MNILSPPSSAFRLHDSGPLFESLTRHLSHSDAAKLGPQLVSASGYLRNVYLQIPSEEGPGALRFLSGKWLASSLHGLVFFGQNDVPIRLYAVLSKDTDLGPTTMAGEIAGAEVIELAGMYCAISPSSALEQVRTSNLNENKKKREGQSDRVREPSSTSKMPAWQAVAAASEDAASRTIVSKMKFTPDTSDSSSRPQYGDFIEHFAFGKAEVLKCDGDRLHIKLIGDGRIKELALDMLNIHLKATHRTKRVFSIVRKI